jgi:hypothetical protein
MISDQTIIWRESKMISVYRIQTHDPVLHRHLGQKKEFELVGWGINIPLWIYRAKFSSLDEAHKALSLIEKSNSFPAKVELYKSM